MSPVGQSPPGMSLFGFVQISFRLNARCLARDVLFKTTRGNMSHAKICIRPFHSAIAFLNLAAAVALTGCQGVYDSFNQKRIPTQVTQGPRDADGSEFSNGDVASSASSVDTTVTSARTTRTSAAGSYEVAADADDSGLAPTRNQRSGSRIRAKALITDEGDRAFLGWYDSQRQEDCDFLRDAEGTLRCLPVSAQGAPQSADNTDQSQFVAANYAIISGQSRVKGYGLVAQDGTVNIGSFYDETLEMGCMWSGNEDAVRCVPQAQRISYYVDQTRARLLIQAESDGSSVTPNIGEHYHTTLCRSDYYRSGEPFQGETVFQWGSQVARPVAPGETFYELGEPIDGRSFAEATVKASTADTGRLTALYWTTPDGDAWFSHWYDNELGTECVFTREQDPRCVPKTKGVSVYYADAQCADLVAEVSPKSECNDEVIPPRYVTVESAVSGASVAYTVLNERTLTTRYLRASDGACEPSIAPERCHYFDLAEPVPASELVGGHLVVE